MIQKVHEGHLGVESCLRRGREAYYWPLMNAGIRDHIRNFCNTWSCGICGSTVGLGDTENVPCDNCNKRQCDYCGDIAVEHLLQ